LRRLLGVLFSLIELLDAVASLLVDDLSQPAANAAIRKVRMSLECFITV